MRSGRLGFHVSAEVLEEANRKCTVTADTRTAILVAGTLFFGFFSNHVALACAAPVPGEGTTKHDQVTKTGTCYNRPGLHQSWTASTSPSRRSAKRGTGRSPTLSAAPVRRAEFSTTTGT